MLNLENKTRDEIVNFLKGQVVPAQVGAGLVQVCNILAGLKDVEEKKDDTNKESEVSA